MRTALQLLRWMRPSSIMRAAPRSDTLTKRPYPQSSPLATSPLMSATQDESSQFSEPPMGMPAQMKLAGLAIMSFLQGVYFALVLAMFYLLSRRITPMTRGKSGKSSDRKLVVGLLVLTVVSTGVSAPSCCAQSTAHLLRRQHWVCLVIRAFEAFIFWEDGQHADLYYSGTATSSSVARAVLHGATAVVSDMFVVSLSYLRGIFDHRRPLLRYLRSSCALQIARLYVIWDYSKWVVIFPSVSLVGQLGTSFERCCRHLSKPPSVSTMGHAQSYASVS